MPRKQAAPGKAVAARAGRVVAAYRENTTPHHTTQTEEGIRSITKCCRQRLKGSNCSYFPLCPDVGCSRRQLLLARRRTHTDDDHDKQLSLPTTAAILSLYSFGETGLVRLPTNLSWKGMLCSVTEGFWDHMH